MAYVIGVDIGTSSTKTMAVLANGKVAAHHQQSYPIHQPQPGHSEQDPAAILQAVKEGIRSVRAEMQEAPAAISFSSAMHSVMAVDGNNRALTPLLIWADNRSQPVADALRRQQGHQALYRQTGTPLHAMSPLCKIAWWRQYEPAMFRAAARFIGIKEYIFFHFFGRYLTDHSIASATGLLDIHTGQWSQAALAVAGITAARLPEAVSSNAVLTGLLPAVAAELGLGPDTRFVAGASDGCLAQLGSNALDEGHATLTIGTSGAVRMAATEAVTDAEGRLFTYVLTPGVYVTGGAVNNGGVALQWFMQHMLQGQNGHPPAMDHCLQQALATPPGAEGLLCLPYLLGERAPVWDGHARGAFIGVQPQHNSWHFLRALLEGVTYGLRSIAEALEQTAGPIKKISVSGGFTASPAWVQLVADVLERPLYLQQEGDASAMGAALLAFGALGIPHRFGEAGPEKVFVPEKAHAAAYRESYRVYRQLYGALKEVFRELRSA